jgi:hypothetical protein
MRRPYYGDIILDSGHSFKYFEEYIHMLIGEAQMAYFGRRFSLSNVPCAGISCGHEGLFVGAVPLLERRHGGALSGCDEWQPRGLPAINQELSEHYGLPIEFGGKVGGLRAVARALSRGDLLHAQIVTLHLEIPDPPVLAKSLSSSQVFDLVRQLHASGLLKEDWDPTKHPRWPAGSPDSIGGRFAPTGVATDNPTATVSDAPIIPAQITIPVPFELPGGIPFPSEILPPPAIPNINPRSNLRNPYPDREGCDEEWERAIKHCNELMANKKFGKDGYRGFGKSFQQCVLGEVSERCGGSLI